LNARLSVASAEANLDNLKLTIENEALRAHADLAAAEADYELAKIRAEAHEQLAQEDLVSDLTLTEFRRSADAARRRLDLARSQLERAEASYAARVKIQEAAVERERGFLALQEQRLASLRVTPGFSGSLQQL